MYASSPRSLLAAALLGAVLLSQPAARANRVTDAWNSFTNAVSNAATSAYQAVAAAAKSAYNAAKSAFQEAFDKAKRLAFEAAGRLALAKRKAAIQRILAKYAAFIRTKAGADLARSILDRILRRKLDATLLADVRRLGEAIGLAAPAGTPRDPQAARRGIAGVDDTWPGSWGLSLSSGVAAIVGANAAVGFATDKYLLRIAGLMSFGGTLGASVGGGVGLTLTLNPSVVEDSAGPSFGFSVSGAFGVGVGTGLSWSIDPKGSYPVVPEPSFSLSLVGGYGFDSSLEAGYTWQTGYYSR